MAQFLINPAVRLEINTVTNSGSAFNKNYKTVDTGNITGCTTTEMYENEIRAIKRLFASYTELIKKDTQDITDFVSHANLMDLLLKNKISTTI